MAEAREDLGRAKGTAYETLETTYTWDDRYEEEGRMPAQEPEKVYDMASNRTFDPKDIEEVKEARRKGPGINLRKAVVLSEILHRPYDETAPSRALWEG